MNALIAGALITWPFLALFCIGQWLDLREVERQLRLAQAAAEEGRQAVSERDAQRLRIAYLETRLRQMTFDALARSVNMIVVRPN